MTKYNWELICKSKNDSELIRIIRESSNPDEFIIAAYDELSKRGKVEEYKITPIDPLVRNKIARRNIVSRQKIKCIFSYGIKPTSVLTKNLQATEEEIFKSIILTTKEMGYKISDINRNCFEIFDQNNHEKQSRNEIKIDFESNFIRVQSYAPRFIITDFGFNHKIAMEFMITFNDILIKKDYIYVDQSMFDDLIYNYQGVFSTISEIFSILKTCFSKTD